MGKRSDSKKSPSPSPAINRTKTMEETLAAGREFLGVDSSPLPRTRVITPAKKSEGKSKPGTPSAKKIASPAKRAKSPLPSGGERGSPRRKPKTPSPSKVTTSSKKITKKDKKEKRGAHFTWRS